MVRCPLAPHDQPRFKVFIDKEAQQSLLHVSFKVDTENVTTPAEYLCSMREDLFQTAMNSRFFRIGRRPDPPFYNAQVQMRSQIECVCEAELVFECAGLCCGKKWWPTRRVHRSQLFSFGLHQIGSEQITATIRSVVLTASTQEKNTLRALEASSCNQVLCPLHAREMR